jgi:carboxypeptidase Q
LLFLGAHDDGGGILQTWEALRLLASMNLRPRRTIRVVMWTNEENGGAGADTYFADYINQLGNTTFCFESDSGTFTPVGFSVAGTNEALQQVEGKHQKRVLLLFT